MRTLFRIVRWNSLSKFEGNHYLLHNYNAFIALFFVQILAISYSATISYGYWYTNSGADVNEDTAHVIALAITISIAVICSILITSVTGGLSRISEVSQLNKQQSETHLLPYQETRLKQLEKGAILDFAVIVACVFFIALDCYANYNGAEPLAQSLTSHYGSADTVSNVDATYLPQIDRLQREKDQILVKYSWCGTHRKQHSIGENCPDNRFIFKAKPKYGISRAQFLSDKAKIERIEKQIESKNLTYDKASSTANTLLIEAKNEYNDKVETRTQSHRYLVFFLYFIVFIATFQNARYAQKAHEHIEEQKHTSQPQNSPKPQNAQFAQNVVSNVEDDTGGDGDVKRALPSKYKTETPRKVRDAYKKLKDEMGGNEEPKQAEIAAEADVSASSVRNYLSYAKDAYNGLYDEE